MNASSTLSLRSWTGVLLGVVLALFVAELTVRILTSGHELPEGWPNARTAALVEELNNADRATEVLFVGNSQAMFAVDPVQYSSSTDVAAFNVGIPAARPPLLHPWLFDVVLESFDQPTVVLIVSPLDFNDNYAPLFSAETLTSSSSYERQIVDSFESRASTWLSRRSSLFRHRQSLSDPDVWALLIADENPFSAGTNVTGGVARFPPFESISEELTERRVEEYALPYEIGSYAESFERLIIRLQDRNIDVVLVSVAMHPDSERLFIDHCFSTNSYLAEIERIAAMTGVRFFDGTDSVADDADYFDPIHMTQTGRESFTNWLAAELTESETSEVPSSRDDRCSGIGF